MNAARAAARRPQRAPKTPSRSTAGLHGAVPPMNEAGVNPLLPKTYKNLLSFNDFECELKDDKINQGSSRSSKGPPKGPQERPEDNQRELQGSPSTSQEVPKAPPKVVRQHRSSSKSLQIGRSNDERKTIENSKNIIFPLK